METEQLAGYLCDIRFDQLDGKTVDAAKMCLEDFLGVAIAGSEKKEAAIWRKYFSENQGKPEATAFEKGFPIYGVEQAAALNAVYGHVMDLDDVHNASITHLGVITIPTAIALGQALKAGGKQIIEAVVAGYEAGARIGEAVNPSAYQYWHTTGIAGTFSAAAAAGKLLGLSKAEMVNAFGSAGTQSSGLWEFLADGAMSKVLHTANANLCGIRAAKLSKLGFTGASKILEGKRGFVRAVARNFDLDALTKGMGGPYRILSNSFKPYACCRHTHSANYCIEKILEKEALEIDEIVKIEDRTYSTALETTNNPYPENPYAAKFSLQFCIAAALLLRELDDRVFREENLKNPKLRALMDKIQVSVDETLDEEFQHDPNQWTHYITITMQDGRRIEQRVDYPIGDFKNPFTWERMDLKFQTVTCLTLAPEKATRLTDQVKRLEQLQDINQLFL